MLMKLGDYYRRVDYPSHQLLTSLMLLIKLSLVYHSYTTTSWGLLGSCCTHELISWCISGQSLAMDCSMEGKAPGSGRRLVNTSQRSLPKLKVSILVDCCSPLNTSGAVYIAAPGPGVLACCTRLAEPKSDSFPLHLLLGRASSRTLALLTSL